MVDIYCDGGAFLGIDMEYDILAEVMRDNIIKPKDFIPIKFSDGSRGAVRKKSINGFCESQEEEV